MSLSTLRFVSSFRGSVAAISLQWTDLTALPWQFWAVVGPLLLLLAIGLVIGVVVVPVYLLSKSDVASGQWRNVGMVLPLFNVLVLLIAYAFYSAEQPRSLGEALRDMVSAELAELLPRAAATEAILLCLFWLLFAAIMRLPRRLVLAPIQALLSLVAFVAFCVLFTVSWINLINATMNLVNATGGSDVVGIVTGMVLIWLAWGVVSVLDDSNPFTIHAGGGGWDTFSLRSVLRRAAETAVFSLIVAFIITVIAGGLLSPPAVEDVVRVELIVFAVIFVLWCLMFRWMTYNLPDVPVSMAGFTNLSLALSATLIAATGVAASPVLLGPVPPLLIAVLPGVLTGAAVFLVDVRPHRRSARAFGICLAASLAAGVLGTAIKPAISALADTAFTALSL